MKPLLYISFLLIPAFCQADTFTMKDGARLEGEITGELDNSLLVKTKYGSLTINRDDIMEHLAAELPPPAAAVEISSAPDPVEISTETAVEISTAQPEAMVEPAPRLTFGTMQTGPAARQLVYFDNGVAVATETIPSGGGPSVVEGTMPNGTYTEYYPDGGLMTVKTMMAGKANGTMKAFYPSGKLQAEAYYLAGGKEGTLKYYTESGALLMQAEYSNDLLNGWKREYGPDGAVLSETHYIDDQPASPPSLPAMAAQAESAPAQPESAVTVKTISLARGERFSFQLNGKYIGKLHLDKNYNLIRQGGKIPDGTIKAYTKDGRLEKEFIFEDRNLKALRVYEPGGPLKAQYSYEKDKAVKK